VPDAVPRIEPRSAYGNPPFYDVFGVRYYVLPSFVGFRERGVASWYGPGFHEERTSTGEPYDMFGMTAAHKTLPLPAYVRVTNLQNGRSVVVRVNDRGPFVNNRIIDLSYTAAAKLDMLHNGTAMVEVAAIDPTAIPAAPTPAVPPTSMAAVQLASTTAVPPAATTAVPPAPTTAATSAPTPAAAVATAAAPLATAAQSAPATDQSAPAAAGPQPAHAPLYIQAGAFASPSNAERLAAKLRGGGYGSIFVREHQIAGRTLYRVRIGPVPDVAEFDRIVAALAQAGVADAHLALD
jgi:rare lipoprotein A